MNTVSDNDDKDDADHSDYEVDNDDDGAYRSPYYAAVHPFDSALPGSVGWHEAHSM